VLAFNAEPVAEGRPADSICVYRHVAGMSICGALHWAVPVLASSGSTTPRLDTELLLAHVLSLTRPQLYVRWDDPLGAAAAGRFVALVQRRADHEPVAYLIGRRCFYDVDLYVDRRVLIPRPETEHLVEEALTWAQSRGQRGLRIVDVGTGSGALAIVLARHLPHAQVWAVDLSREALCVARRNLERHGLGSRVSLVCGDLLSSFAGRFDLIVANLPYVPREALHHLSADIAAFEPHVALDGGQDGLATIRRLLAQCPQRLASPGLMVLEIGDGQGQGVRKTARRHLPCAETTVGRDYAGLERVVRVERRVPVTRY